MVRQDTNSPPAQSPERCKQYYIDLMQRLALSIILFLIFQTTFGQTKSIQGDELLFEKGVLLQQLVYEDLDLGKAIRIKDSTNIKSEFATEIKETIFEKALEYYQELIDNFPDSRLLYRALNNKGFIEHELGKKEEAKKSFLAILNSNADDKESGGVGSGFMEEPYANYKNRAAKQLARITLEDSNYRETLEYLDQTKKYPYRHFCGNEFAEDEIYVAKMYAKSYIGLKEYQKAYEFLLPNILDNGLADNSDLVDIAYKVLLKTYQRVDLRNQFEQAFKNYKTEKVKSGKGEYNQYFITFLKTKMRLSSLQFYDLKPDEIGKEIDNIYKKSHLFKLLNEWKIMRITIAFAKGYASKVPQKTCNFIL